MNFPLLPAESIEAAASAALRHWSDCTFNLLSSASISELAVWAASSCSATLAALLLFLSASSIASPSFTIASCSAALASSSSVATLSFVLPLSMSLLLISNLSISFSSDIF
ncbi:hypothetical protein GQ457_12G026820 [Hibiscus cannabinus]